MFQLLDKFPYSPLCFRLLFSCVHSLKILLILCGLWSPRFLTIFCLQFHLCDRKPMISRDRFILRECFVPVFSHRAVLRSGCYVFLGCFQHPHRATEKFIFLSCSDYGGWDLDWQRLIVTRSAVAFACTWLVVVFRVSRFILSLNLVPLRLSWARKQIFFLLGLSLFDLWRVKTDVRLD